MKKRVLALVCCGLLAGCGAKAPAGTTIAAAEGSAEDIGALPLPQRLAFMTGHTVAGIALYRAGEPELAAPHLRHPVAETHAAERAGLEALGFEPARFEAVAQALAAGVAAEDVEAQLLAAETHLAELSQRAGGDPAVLIRFLMDTLDDEYAEGVVNGRIENLAEAQDAWGFLGVATRLVPRLQGARAAEVSVALGQVVRLLPAVPMPDATLPPVSEVRAATDAVRAALGN